jgi:hypothetical protein
MQANAADLSQRNRRRVPTKGAPRFGDGFLLGTEERPSQTLFFAVTGGAERRLKIPLDLSQPPVSYAEQALAVVRKMPFVQFFGRTTGFIVNYTPDHAVRFDCKGRPVETLARSHRPWEVSVTLGRRAVSAEAFGKALGTWPPETPRKNPNGPR